MPSQAALSIGLLTAMVAAWGAHFGALSRGRSQNWVIATFLFSPSLLLLIFLKKKGAGREIPPYGNALELLGAVLVLVTLAVMPLQFMDYPA